MHTGMPPADGAGARASPRSHGDRLTRLPFATGTHSRARGSVSLRNLSVTHTEKALSIPALTLGGRCRRLGVRRACS